MIKRITTLFIIATLFVSGLSSQTKRELKAIEKRQKAIAETTTENGERFFTNTMYEHTLKPIVKSCTRNGSTVTIEMMVWNTSDDIDQDVCFSCNGAGFTVSKAVDNLGNIYNGSTSRCFSFDFRGADENKIYYTTETLFLPAGAPLKVTLSIKGVNTNATTFSNLSFLIHSTSIYDGVAMVFKIIDLPIE